MLTEYIRSLNEYNIPTNHYIHELVINLLVSHKRFFQLHQFLQYHIVRDSVHVACLLLSLEATYPPAYQLAIDMLARLEKYDQILEVMLLKKQVIGAIRFSRSHSMDVPPSKFLEAALAANDKLVLIYLFCSQEANTNSTYQSYFSWCTRI